MGFSRNPAKFALPRYVQYVPTQQMVFLYAKLSPQESFRFVTPQEKEWPDAQPRPMHPDGMEQFNLVEGRTHRYDYGSTFGDLTAEQAFYDILAFQSGVAATQCMTHRSNRMIVAATTSTAWTIAGTGSSGTSSEYDLSVDHTATATSVSGGLWDAGSSTSPYLKKGLDAIEVIINKETGGVISRPDLMLVINPDCARRLAESAEVHDYIKGSYWAKEELNKQLGPNPKFGIPSEIYGMPIVIDDTVNVTSRKGATLAKSYAFPNQKALVVSRVGGLEGIPGGVAFSTLSLYYYKGAEMDLEVFKDPKHRFTEVHVSENVAEVVTCPLSGYYVTSVTS